MVVGLDERRQVHFAAGRGERVVRGAAVAIVRSIVATETGLRTVPTSELSGWDGGLIWNPAEALAAWHATP